MKRSRNNLLIYQTDKSWLTARDSKEDHSKNHSEEEDSNDENSQIRKKEVTPCQEEA